MTELLVGLEEGPVRVARRARRRLRGRAPRLRRRRRRVRDPGSPQRAVLRERHVRVLRPPPVLRRRPRRRVAAGERPRVSRGRPGLGGRPASGSSSRPRRRASSGPGTAPASLWRSEDDGESWTLNRPLWNVPTRPEWEPGAGGLALHSICPWPGDPDRLAVGISAAGVWLSDDRGESWRTGYTGLEPLYLPEDAREGSHALCVHNMRRAPLAPERLFMQFHGSVYRSDDAGATWTDIASGLPSGFGFPLVVDAGRPGQRVRHPARPRTSTGSRRRGACACTRRATPGRAGRPARTACRPKTPTSRFCARPSTPTPAPRRASTSAPRPATSSARRTADRSWFAAATRLAPVNSVRVSG